LCDAFQVPKPSSPQLQPFGKSDDDLGELTLGELRVFVSCSSCSCSPFVSIHRGFEFWLDEVSDGPRVLGGRSAGAWRTVRMLPADGPLFAVCLWWFWCLFRTVRGVGPDSPRCWCGRSAAAGRTVRVSSADGPPLLAGRSARAYVLRFLVRFLPSFLVLPRMLQGIVPRTRG
jgi:hypothetical protein